MSSDIHPFMDTNVQQKVRYYPKVEQKIKFPLDSIMEEVNVQPSDNVVQPLGYDLEAQTHGKDDEDKCISHEYQQIAPTSTTIETIQENIHNEDLILSSKLGNNFSESLNNSSRSSNSRKDDDYHLFTRKGSIFIGQNTSEDESNSTAFLPIGKNGAESIHDFPTISTCSICMQNYDVGDDICWSMNDTCKHCFHVSCITPWLMKHDDCPLCRENYLVKSSPSMKVRESLIGNAF